VQNISKTGPSTATAGFRKPLSRGPYKADL